MNFVHFGAGAGDLDPSSNFRDGFSEYIKNHKSKRKKKFIWLKQIKKYKKIKINIGKITIMLNFLIVQLYQINLKKKKKLFYSEDGSTLSAFIK